MKTLIQLNSTPYTIKMENGIGKHRAEFGREIGQVSGHFQPSGKSIPLDFRLISDRPIKYTAHLQIGNDTFYCDVTIYKNDNRIKPFAAVTECKFIGGKI